MTGASWVSQRILRDHPSAKLHLFAIWVDMMPTDERSAWPGGMFRDARVTSLWDQDDLIGHWLGEHRTGGLGSTATPFDWDAYLAYDAGVRWSGAPTEPVSAGSTVIAHAQELDDSFLPLLRQ